MMNALGAMANPNAATAAQQHAIQQASSAMVRRPWTPAVSIGHRKLVQQHMRSPNGAGAKNSHAYAISCLQEDSRLMELLQNIGEEWGCHRWSQVSRQMEGR